MQPDHPGQLVQIGWNTGARHKRSFGPGWSFKGPSSKLAAEVRLPYDSDAVGVSSMLWYLARSCLPDEVINPIETALNESCLPRMATLTIPEGI